MKLKLANGSEYPIIKASKIYDIVGDINHLDIDLGGSNIDNDYNTIVEALKVETNLKNLTITRDIGDIVFADVELSYSSLDIEDNQNKGFLSFKIK